VGVVIRRAQAADSGRFVEFETGADLKTAVSKLDGQEFKGAVVHCAADVSLSCRTVLNLELISPQIQDERDLRNYRQRSPLARGRYGPPADEHYDRRGPPPARGYSPRGYRERSPGVRRPPPYDEYYDRGYARRTPPRDYGPPPPRRYEDPYEARGPPPPARGYDPYARADPYARPRSPPPARGYGSYGGGGGGYRGYDDRPY